VTLDYDHRCRRRVLVQSDSGVPLLLDFARPPRLRQGDGLVLEGGGLVEVLAAPESLLEITCDSRLDLVRVAWHIGNRHCPAALEEAAVLIREDHVLAAMVAGLGASVRAVLRPFDPEGGAYEGRSGAGEAHHHGHGHDHDRNHGHGHHHHHGAGEPVGDREGAR
jgi:urease accessory protein